MSIARPALLESLTHRSAAHHGETRVPAGIGLVAAAAMHAALPNELLLEPRWVIPAIELVLIVPLVAANPMRLTRESRYSRGFALALVTVVIVTNLISLGYLLRELTAMHVSDGRGLLLAAAQVWLTNIVAFALVYWELDRGGAVARLASSGVQARRADFLFPQDDPSVARDENPTAASSDWMPTFVDYLYVSLTNSTAFSPTDTLPLTTRMKLLMSVQALAALVTSLLVIARAVNVLN